MGGSRSRGEGLTVILSLLSLRTLGGAGVFALAQAGSSPRPLLFLVARRGRERRGHYPTSTQSLRARAGPGRLAGFGEFKSFTPGHAGERRSILGNLIPTLHITQFYLLFCKNVSFAFQTLVIDSNLNSQPGGMPFCFPSYVLLSMVNPFSKPQVKSHLLYKNIPKFPLCLSHN